MVIDLNCDLGEGAGTDADLLPLITSANVSCGVHAGTRPTSPPLFALAARLGVAVGAHPGHPDRERLRPPRVADPVPRRARRDLSADPLAEARWPSRFGVKVRYVKPHGALYNQACRDDGFADAVVSACALAACPWSACRARGWQERAIGRVPNSSPKGSPTAAIGRTGRSSRATSRGRSSTDPARPSSRCGV